MKNIKKQPSCNKLLFGSLKPFQLNQQKSNANSSQKRDNKTNNNKKSVSSILPIQQIFLLSITIVILLTINLSLALLLFLGLFVIYCFRLINMNFQLKYHKVNKSKHARSQDVEIQLKQKASILVHIMSKLIYYVFEQRDIQINIIIAITGLLAIAILTSMPSYITLICLIIIQWAWQIYQRICLRYYKPHKIVQILAQTIKLAEKQQIKPHIKLNQNNSTVRNEGLASVQKAINQVQDQNPIQKQKQMAKQQVGKQQTSQLSSGFNIRRTQSIIYQQNQEIQQISQNRNLHPQQNLNIFHQSNRINKHQNATQKEVQNENQQKKYKQNMQQNRVTLSKIKIKHTHSNG